MLPRRLFGFARLPALRAPTLLPTFRPTRNLPLTNAPRSSQSRLFQHFPARLNSPPSSEPLPADATRMQRLKHLFKSYGFYALGVYLVISVFDFGLAFGLIHLIGADYVEHLTKVSKDFVLGYIRNNKPPEPGLEQVDPAPRSGQEGIYAMLLLAYGVHKTLFLPLRVGLTAFLTPSLVRWLRQRGWAGSAGTKRAATQIRERLRKTTRDD
ncbi:DUF1279 domain-containing protein [Mycena indigotica]|uniref:DUF1279 domain-containing protein n=1 Tax=Mycena indigotica TaxID=2126181 RepID=A0A8H6WE31_9AGAR|nr:DUF1279 domain-containing protein [Mycena indigotica]KAF7315299.1 DUF1279 domain-containing protein [Mycena indigotica]